MKSLLFKALFFAASLLVALPAAATPPPQPGAHRPARPPRPPAPKVGEQAPDFTLQLLNSEETVQLSSFIGERPVALVFGSYT